MRHVLIVVLCVLSLITQTCFASDDPVERFLTEHEEEIRKLRRQDEIERFYKDRLLKYCTRSLKIGGFHSKVAYDLYRDEVNYLLREKIKFVKIDGGKLASVDKWQQTLHLIKVNRPILDKIESCIYKLGVYMQAAQILVHLADALEGNDQAKLLAFSESVALQSGWLVRSISHSSLSCAMGGVAILDIGLRWWMESQHEKYHDYWWNAYSHYYNSQYQHFVHGQRSWVNLLQREGPTGIEKRLAEFWDDALDNAAMYKVPGPRERDALAMASFRKPFAARYFHDYLLPSLRSWVQRQAEEGEYEMRENASLWWKRMETEANELREFEAMLEAVKRQKKNGKATDRLLADLVSASMQIRETSPGDPNLSCTMSFTIPDSKTLEERIAQSGLEIPRQGCKIALLAYLWSNSHSLHEFAGRYPKGGASKWKGGLLNERAMLISGGNLVPGTPMKPLSIVIPTDALKPGTYSVTVEYYLLDPDGKTVDTALVPKERFEAPFTVTASAAIPLRQGDLDFDLEVCTSDTIKSYYTDDMRELPGITIDWRRLRDIVADGTTLPVCYDRLVVIQKFQHTPRQAESTSTIQVVNAGGQTVMQAQEIIPSEKSEVRHPVALQEQIHKSWTPLPEGEYAIVVSHQSKDSSVRVKREFRFRLHPVDWRSGNTPRLGVYRAAEKGDAETVRKLLSAGASRGMHNGGTSVCAAAVGGHLEVLKLLLAAGAEAGYLIQETTNGLMLAAAGGFVEVAEPLIDAGVDVNLRGYKGNTALHYAVLKGRRPMIDMLLRRGASPQVKDAAGRIPGYYAWWHLKDAELARRLGYHVPKPTEAEGPGGDDFGSVVGEMFQAFAQGVQVYQQQKAVQKQFWSSSGSSSSPSSSAKPARVPQSQTPTQNDRREPSPSSSDLWYVIESLPGAFPDPREKNWRAVQHANMKMMTGSGKWKMIRTFSSKDEAFRLRDSMNDAFQRNWRK